MTAAALTHVDPVPWHPALSEGSHGRAGTALAARGLLACLLGEPGRPEYSDQKVTTQWFLRTPRGLVCLRDYWWNKPDEWTIAGGRRASLWAAAWLRSHGIPAGTGRAGYELQANRRAGLVRGPDNLATTATREETAP